MKIQSAAEKLFRRKKSIAGGALALLVAGALVWQSLPTQAAPLGNLAAYWKFDETTAGSTAVDSSGNSNSLTPTNSPTPSTNLPSAMGKAFPDSRSANFDGSTQYFSAADNSTFDNTNAVSVSAWVRFNNVSGNQTIAAKWQVGAKQQWVLQLDSLAHISWWTGDGGSGSADQLTSSTAISTGTWYHIVATATSGSKRLYINGSLDNSNNAGAMGLASGTPVTVGSKMTSSSTFFEYLNGNIDDVRVYSRVLNAAEAGDLSGGAETTATWTGTTSNAYGTASNWDTGAVPDAYTNVVIPKTTRRAILGQDVSTAHTTVATGGILDLNGFHDSLNDTNDTSKIENHGTVISQNSETGTSLDTSDGTVMYNNTTSKTGLLFGGTYHDLKFNDGLAGYWPLEEGNAGSTAADSSGYGNQATPTGNPTPTTDVPSAAKFADSRSLSFDGSTQYLSIPSSPELSPASSLTLSAWVKAPATNMAGAPIACKGSGSGGEVYCLDFPSANDLTPRFYFYKSGVVHTVVASSALPASTWAQVTATYDGSTLTIYVNGVSKGTASFTGTLDQNAHDLTIGCRQSSSGGYDRCLAGQIDDMRVYSRALSSTEISRLGSGDEPATSVATTTLNGALNVASAADLNSDLAGYFKLDETTAGSSVADSSGHSDSGTPFGTSGTNNLPQPSTDTKMRAGGDSLNFDGTDDYVSIPNAPQLNFKGAFTISAWVKPSSLTQQGQIVAKSDANGVPAVYSLFMDGTGRAAFQTYDGSFHVVTDTAQLSTSAWTLVTGVYDGTEMRLYVNGVSAGTPVTVSQPNANGAPLTIGGFSGNQRFTGNIDDVRLYGRALNTDQVTSLSGDLYHSPGDLTINSGTLDVSASNYAVTLLGNFVNNGGVFTPQSGTVVLHGGDATINSSNSFYNLTLDISSGFVLPHTLTFGQGSTTTVTHALTLKGGSSVPLTLASSLPGTQWKLNSTATNTLSNLIIKDSNNLGSTLAPTNTTDSGDNTNWDFSTPNAPDSLASSGSPYTANDHPSVSFNLSDPDSGALIRYRIQVDDSSDFSSPVVDFTSSPAGQNQGAGSFLVGQGTAGGTYAAGSAGQTLADGAYYWRVQAIDLSGLTSGWTTANGGGVAFTVDTIAPTTPGTPTTTAAQTNNNMPTFSWAVSSDSGSGLGDPAYTVEWSQDTLFSGLGGIAGVNATSYTIPWTIADGTWYFRVQAVDKAGNTSAWSGAATVVVDTVLPVITDTTVTSVTDTSAAITWTTDKQASSQVAYGKTASYGSLTAETDTSPRVTSHSATLTGLAACTTYHFQALTADELGNLGRGSDGTFTTTGCVAPLQTTPAAPTTTQTSSGQASSGTAPAPSSTTTIIEPPKDSTQPVLGNKDLPAVKFENTGHSQDNGKNTSAFLGLGWWWLPIIVLIALSWWLVPRRKRTHRQDS